MGIVWIGIARAALVAAAIIVTAAPSAAADPKPDRPPIEYPQAAYDAGVEGFVRLRVVIAPAGEVIDATVVEAKPPGWFEEAAVNGVKRWRYRAPGREVIFEIVVEFKLPPDEEPEPPLVLPPQK